MRILKKKINFSKGIGFLFVMPTEEDDFWHLYNIIQFGDIVKTSTQRKVVRESATGSKVSERRKITVILKVCEIHYWAEHNLLLSIKGKNCRESPFLSLGQYHNLQFEFNVPITIYKENWDAFHYRIIKEISETSDSSDVGALIMEEGVAHLCYITQSTTLLKQKIQKNVTKKKSGQDQRSKTLTDFFQLCLGAIQQEDMLNKVKCMIVASPGYVKDDFMKYLKAEVTKEQYRDLAKGLSKIVLVKSSSGYLQSLMEILQDPNLMNTLSNTKAMSEVKILDQFFTMLKTDCDRIAYGLKDVLYAHAQGAIQNLLLTDQLARTRDLKKRKSYITLMDEVKNKGGETHIFSSLHPTGTQLNGFTGIAAILFFPVLFNYEADDEDDISLSEDESQQVQTQDLPVAKLDDQMMQEFDEFDTESFI